jgi:hypothetical protein
MPNNANKKELEAISNKFYRNLDALRIFNEQIGQLAEEYDQSLTMKYIEQLIEMVGISKDVLLSPDTPFVKLKVSHNIQDLEIGGSKLEVEINKKPSEEILNQTISENSKGNDDETVNDGELSKDGKVIKVEVEDRENFINLLGFLNQTKRSTNAQSKLLRHGALTSLTSYFESLEVDLLQYFYLSFPNALPSEGKLLSLADLRSIGSIEEAEKILIDKEIDSLMHEGTATQIEYFTKRPKVDLKCLNPYLEMLLEIMLRRNLFVHNDGIVNKFYLDGVSKEYIKQNNIKEGDTLECTGNYLSDAIDTICICGTILIQQAWRKWNEKNTKNAESVINSYTYDLLIEKRWNLVERLAEYASGLQFISEADARIIIINHAIALKEQNKLAEMESLLSKKDWSSQAIKFHVAIFALKEQYSFMIPYLRKSVAADEIGKDAIKEWPLFRWFRESEDFQSVMKGLFPDIV